MDYMNFEVGEKFPLPIQAAGDGGLFQVDDNGCLFILQLSKTDLIATEAFRTGKMEFALYEENGLLFFLYQIDGIFKTGWGDAPLALHRLKEEHQPAIKQLQEDKILHLYLVDARLNTLLSMRRVPLQEKFFQKLLQHIERHQDAPLTEADYQNRLQKIWQNLQPAEMRQKAAAVQKVPLAIPAAPCH